MEKQICKMHVSTRPYERLEKMGERTLSDAELLAILIRTGAVGMSSIDVAHEVLSNDHNAEGLGFLVDQSIEELCQSKGMGKVKAITLKAALELGRRATTVVPYWKNMQISGPEDAISYFEQHMRHLKKEEVHAALMDTRHRVIRHVVISSGGLASTGIYPREIFREAIKSNASAIILAHNHPSGDPEPSADDIRTTNTILKSSDIIGISIIDHIVIGRGQSRSIKQLGFMER